MKFERIFCPQDAALGLEIYDAVIAHDIFCHVHRSFRIIGQLEIRPKRATDESEAVELENRIFENMDLAAIGVLFQSLSQLRNRVPIKLVIAEDIDYVLISKMPMGPFSAFFAQ